MSMTDYYNGVADANMKQLWGNVGAAAAERANAKAQQNEIDRVIDEANAEIDKAWASYVREKKIAFSHIGWKKGFIQAMKDYLKERFPDTWEDEWAKVDAEVDKYAVPYIHKKFQRIDEVWPSYVGDKRAFFELPPMPDEIADLPNE